MATSKDSASHPAHSADATERSFAERLDLERHVNEDTALIGGALCEHLGTEAGMQTLAHLIRTCGGLRLRLVSARTASAAVDRERARRLFEKGVTLYGVVQQTSLSAYQAGQVQAAFEAETKEAA